MDIYLKHLVAAFNLVDKRYYSSDAFCGGDGKGESENREKYKQYVERVFAYELYYQLRKIIDSNPKVYNGIYLNAEITKNGFEETILGKNRIFPDLVIHKSQTDNAFNNQKLFVEIKVSENSKVKGDLEKLIVALGDRLNFQNAVFLCINNDFEKLIEKIKNCFENELKVEIDKAEKLWLLCEKGIFNIKEIIE